MRLIAGLLAAVAAFVAGSAWAGPVMTSASFTMAASGLTVMGSSRSYDGSGFMMDGFAAEPVQSSTGPSSANFVLGAGYGQVYAFPGPVQNLTPRSDVTTSSATLTFTAPGYEGLLGNLTGGTRYAVVVASYTSPNPFVVTNGVLTSTSGVVANTTAGVGSTGLIPNTTWYGQMWVVDAAGNSSYPQAFGGWPSTFTTLALPPTLASGASAFLTIAVSTYSINVASVTVGWVALANSPPDASSKTSEGYILRASSDNFTGTAPVYSSTTFSVLASTLTLGAAGVPLDLANTYYFQVGTLNWNGQANYGLFPTLNFQIQQSTGLIHLGSMDPSVARSTVSTSSMVVTNLGNFPMTIELTASTATAGSSPWTLGTVPGNEIATMKGLWNAGAVGPAAGSFSTFLTTNTTISQSAGNYVGTQTGFQILPGQSRTLWFNFTMPNSSSSLGPETIQVLPMPVYP